MPVEIACTQYLGEEIKELTVVKDGLIRYYDAKNNTGDGHSNSATTWKDLSEHQNGIINGGAKFTRDCLQFDGQDDNVNIGKVEHLNQYTFTVTLKAEQTESTHIISNYNPKIGGFCLHFYETNNYKTWTLGARYLNLELRIFDANVRMNPDTFFNRKHTITATYDGDALKFYIDGNLQTILRTTEAQIEESFDDMRIGSNASGIEGARPNDMWEHLKGDVYTVRIYDRALSQAEIQQNIKADGIINQDEN